MAEAHLQTRLGISYDHFLEHGHEQLPSDIFSELSRDLLSLTSGVQLLIAGFFRSPYDPPWFLSPEGNPAMIYRVSGDSVGETEHFACIGSGAFLAESALYYREHNSMQSVDQTLYAVYEAKRSGEKAPGVGKRTNLGILKWDRQHGPRFLVVVGTEKLEQHFVRLSPQPIRIDEPILGQEDVIDLGLLLRSGGASKPSAQGKGRIAKRQSRAYTEGSAETNDSGPASGERNSKT